MVLRIRKKGKNRIFHMYLLVMFALMAFRYVGRMDVPAAAFLLVSLLPICFGSTSEQLAFVASCIPLSVAFQYKYALLILAVAMLVRNHWRLRSSGTLLIVAAMMVWELLHVFYGQFSYVEYLRGFAEVILLGIVTSIDLSDLDYKLVLRALSVSIVGVCCIMLFMQLQQFNFNLAAIFARSAASFRFGQSNMDAGRFALNFNANNLGFICNLSTCAMLLLITRKEYGPAEIGLAVLSMMFALMTMSRAAIVCMVMIFAAFLLCGNGSVSKKMQGTLGGLAIAAIALLLMRKLFPAVFDNILERFQRADIWNGRGGLMYYYNQFLLSSPMYLLFGIGMQNIFQKVALRIPVQLSPHNGIQEVWVAWGLVGVVLVVYMIWKIIRTSKLYSSGKRRFYQFMPLILTLVFTMSGQFLTSSRTLMALIISYICLCAGDKTSQKAVTEAQPEAKA